MTTIINTPPSGDSSDSVWGLVLGVIIAIVLIVLFFIYALPALRQNDNQPTGSTNTIIVPAPTPIVEADFMAN